MMTSTIDLTRLQSDLKDIKGEYEFQNTQNGTHIITKEMADYSAMKSHWEKNNLYYFTFSPNSGKPIKAVIRHLPTDTPAEDVSNELEDVGFNVINECEVNDGHSSNTQWTNLRGTPPYVPCYLKKKHKI
jgi:hypothetical protein